MKLNADKRGMTEVVRIGGGGGWGLVQFITRYNALNKFSIIFLLSSLLCVHIVRFSVYGLLCSNSDINRQGL